MAKSTDTATLQTQVATLVQAIQALITFVGDYPPEDTWHAAKRAALAEAKRLIASLQ